jgi:hypothetical protein
MVDSWLHCHTSSPEGMLEAAPVGETSPLMRGNTEECPGILTEGFDSGKGLAVVDSGGGNFCLVRDSLEHGEANVEAARCCGDKKMGPQLLL